MQQNWEDVAVAYREQVGEEKVTQVVLWKWPGPNRVKGLAPRDYLKVLINCKY